ncbi:hypothetical protein O181_019641 [Austropuccinia psidii MF-1]|uniref:Integrase catalytic domain-containing protein n=1 Tax=Austropuccinia psidii MF-1 TaxID=1389203 RepID=A0A9Q3C7J9_9BASI|nr:hypothetical protein [Austropuccinia psidii MF-1]
MIYIQERKSPWEVIHMDWFTEFPQSGDKSYNSYLVIAERYRKTLILLLFCKDDTSVNIALLLWNRVIYHTGLFKNIISNRDPKLTLALFTNIHRFFGTTLLFSTEYHPQIDGLAERMIQALEDMIRGFCAFSLGFKYSYGFTHYWCTLIPALELAYRSSIHHSTGQTLPMLEKGWNPSLSADTLRKDMIEIHLRASRFKIILEKVENYSKISMADYLNI